MVDHVYKGDLPALRQILEKLKQDLSERPAPPQWLRRRVEALIRHTKALEDILGTSELSKDSYRLRGGVVFLHSDLVYLRTNVKGLEELLRLATDRPRVKRGSSTSRRSSGALKRSRRG